MAHALVLEARMELQMHSQGVRSTFTRPDHTNRDTTMNASEDFPGTIGRRPWLRKIKSLFGTFPGSPSRRLSCLSLTGW
jgi:hypothetical protein